MLQGRELQEGQEFLSVEFYPTCYGLPLDGIRVTDLVHLKQLLQVNAVRMRLRQNSYAFAVM